MCKRHLSKSVTRRDVIRYTLAGAGIMALGPLAGRIPVASGDPILGHKRVVLIFAYGGYDGLSYLIPKTNSFYLPQRPDIGVPAADALDLTLPGETADADYGLHPRLDRTAGMYADGDVAIFRKVGYPGRSLSHFDSTDYYEWAVRGGFSGLPVTESGWVARYADVQATGPMGVLSLGLGRPQTLEGAQVATPVMINSLASFDFSDSSISDDDHAYRLQIVQELLNGFSGTGMTAEAAAALDQGHQLAEQIQAAIVDTPFIADYPNNDPGRRLRDIARLIQHGFDTRIFMCGVGGWDTHANQTNEGDPANGSMPGRLQRVDDAVGAFSDDMKAMGIWDDTLVLLASEFGRRNSQNGGRGTDHGEGNQFFAWGGDVNGGLYGPEITDDDVNSAVNRWLPYGLDFRDIYREAVGNHLGASATDVATILPETQDIDTTLNYV